MESIQNKRTRFSPRFPQRLGTFLFASTLPFWRYCLIAYIVMAIPALILVLIAAGVLTLFGIDLSSVGPAAKSMSVMRVVGAVLIAPIAETLILAWMLTVLSSTNMRTGTIALICGLAWGLFHGMFGPLWFFGPAWAFFVMSCAYLHWRKISFKHAFWATAIPHAVNNSVALLAIFPLGA
jgi:hypothetical protein